ncbi:hypothetical protein CO083_05210 [Candidatus Roizmanbacteria bacterium CG_4_9_14_0_8_um_filter_34_12]|uniref:S-adenosylmethionine:tRNA ribosyltransferase-isomerase n=2 Tax=Candidatus Roizmaniibacteriota TaxID=1752723 RepID=A0A2M8DBL2_9BACT|nr:MAG: hypothetical protein CO083_05210 [Candidatus Roizmanbacteria bacterium CG_4_9_14_0_8_um_filter_34_12]
MKSINQFDYYLPPESIAKQPAVPRDYSRLFVYDTKTNEIVFDKFYNLDKYLPKKSFLVMNDTKVLPARVEMKKATGGKVRVLFLVNEIMSSSQYQVLSIEQNTIRIFVDRKVDVGDKLFFNSQYFVTVTAQEEHIFTVQFDFSIGELFRILEKKGTMPIPLYIKNSPLSRNDLLHKYQTIFARVPVGTRLIGRSAAAPTASLHFTNRLLSKLEKKRINKTFITLHVGMGTFASVTDVNIRQKKLHEEYFEINNETLQLINLMKQERKKLVAVGTTVVRTLESAEISLRQGRGQLESVMKRGHSGEEQSDDSRIKLRRFWTSQNGKDTFISKTDLFIQSGFKFQYVDSLITNFHLPGSSLMMLVEAFLQHKQAKHHLVNLYQIAIKEKFRFYSFGDGMLIR